MKKLAIITAAMAGVALSATTSQAQLAIGDANATTTISGNVLTLGNFTVAGDSAITGSFGGPFTINVPATLVGGLFYQSSITGSQTMTLTTSDSDGTLTALVSLIQLDSLGSINPGLVINLSNITYTPGTGTDADLAYLATSKLGTLNITTQVSYNSALQQWSTIPGGGTTYSGTLAPVPEANTIAAGALMLLPLGIGAIRAIRKERTA